MKGFLTHKTNNKTMKKEKEITPEFDLTKILDVRKIYYFNEGYYAYDFPNNIDDEYLKSVPNDKFIYRGTDRITVYPAGSTTILGREENKAEINDWKARLGLFESSILSEVGLIRGSKIHDVTDRAEKQGLAVIYNDRKSPEFSDKEIEEYKTKSKRKVIVVDSQDVWVQICRYRKILTDLRPYVVCAEEKLFNIKEFYAGTIDRIWDFKEDVKQYENTKRLKLNIKAGRYIVDLKSGKVFDKTSYWRQLASYYFGALGNEKMQGAIIVHLNYDQKAGIEGGRVHVMYRDQLKDYYEDFLALKRMFYKEATNTPRHYELPSIVVFDKIRTPKAPKKIKKVKKSNNKKNVKAKSKRRSKAVQKQP